MILKRTVIKHDDILTLKIYKQVYLNYKLVYVIAGRDGFHQDIEQSIEELIAKCQSDSPIIYTNCFSTYAKTYLRQRLTAIECSSL